MKNLAIALVAFALFIAGAVWAAKPAPKNEIVDPRGVLALASPKAGTFHPVVWNNDLVAIDATSGTVWLLRDKKWIKFADGIFGKSLTVEPQEARSSGPYRCVALQGGGYVVYNTETGGVATAGAAPPPD